jgi:hypothetical protein|tara:strand:- start:195 stop:803 length:609 start_codon:yes stop_codon:yes gene_type:complete
MAILDTQPTNPQFLSPLGFNFQIRKLPNVNYFAQSVNLPSVTVGNAELPTPFKRVPIPGDEMTLGDLSVTFKVDEDMNNYIEIFNWLQYISFPESFTQSKEVYGKDGMKGLTGLKNVQRTGRSLGEGSVSDATLTVLSSASKPNLSITYQDCFPTSLSDLVFDTRQTDVDYIEASATFRFKFFNIDKISSSGNSNTAVRING